MATVGTPNGGLDEIALRTYVNGADLTLVAYQNTADSLDADTVAADLTQPATANGYAPILLDGTWASTNGVVTYTHSTPTHPKWSATGSWGGDVTGAAIIYGTEVMHFKDLTTAFTAASGKSLTIDLTTLVA